MNSLINYIYAQCLLHEAQEKQMCNEFSKRKEQARQLYWDACNYPRKKKKILRKQAKSDFKLYSILEKPLIFTA